METALKICAVSEILKPIKCPKYFGSLEVYQKDDSWKYEPNGIQS